MKSILISEELHTKLKIKVSKEKKQIKEVIEKLIKDYLEKK